MKQKRIDTTWELWTYDVWGNAEDGYEVNDRSCLDREYHIRCVVQTANASRPELAFDYAFPSDWQIRNAFSTRCAIDTGRDDMHITVDRARDGYPIGEMQCISHKSLSPVEALDNESI